MKNIFKTPERMRAAGVVHIQFPTLVMMMVFLFHSFPPALAEARYISERELLSTADVVAMINLETISTVDNPPSKVLRGDKPGESTISVELPGIHIAESSSRYGEVVQASVVKVLHGKPGSRIRLLVRETSACPSTSAFTGPALCFLKRAKIVRMIGSLNLKNDPKESYFFSPCFNDGLKRINKQQVYWYGKYIPVADLEKKLSDHYKAVETPKAGEPSSQKAVSPNENR